MRAETYRRRLRDRALDQYGYITTRDAAELRIPAVELGKLASRGGLTHVAYGLYRFDDVPPTERDQFMEAVLRAGGGAYLVMDAVLALYDLAQVNPRRIRVGVPRRVRLKAPDVFEYLERDVPASDLTVHEGIPTTTVARAIEDSRPFVMRDRLAAAVEEARRRGLLDRHEWSHLRPLLGASHSAA